MQLHNSDGTVREHTFLREMEAEPKPTLLKGPIVILAPSTTYRTLVRSTENGQEPQLESALLPPLSVAARTLELLSKSKETLIRVGCFGDSHVDYSEA